MQPRRISLLFSSSLALTGAAAALLSPIPRAYGAMIAAAAFTGLLWDLRGTHFLPRRLLTALGAAGFLFTLFPARRETLAEQSLAALTILLAVKLLEIKERRDHLQILALSAVITVGAGSLAPELAFGTLIFTICFLGTFYLLWLPFSDIRGASAHPGLLGRLSKIALALILFSLPLTFLLFIVLPRSVNPFWGGLAPSRQQVSGFSDQISLGEVGRLALSRDVAFRAEMVSPPAPLTDIPYWRGVVMEETDGKRWSTLPSAVSVRVAADPSAVRVVYYVEPHGERQLFLLEQPAAVYLGLRSQPISRSGVFRLRTPLFKRIRYQGLSRPSAVRPGKLSGEERKRNLQLPAGFSPTIAELAGGLTADAQSPGEKVERLLAFFDDSFTYSLELPPSRGDPLENFIFRSLSGYCEYFASALAVMLRSVDVPARVVAGYLGGEYNKAGNYYLVTQSAAHTWVEAWIDGEGWKRFDPTPAAGEFGGTFASRSLPRSSLWIDSLRMKWNSWVVQYDAEVQIGLVRKGARSLFRARLPDIDREDLARGAPWLLTPLVLFLLLMAMRARRGDPLHLRYRRFNRLMARRGLGRRTWEGPLDHGRRIGKDWPGAARAAAAFTSAYARHRYGGADACPAEIAALDGHLRALKRTKKKGAG